MSTTNILKHSFLLFIFVIVHFIASADDGCYCFYVNAPNGLNLRTGPSLDSAIVKKLDFGTKVEGFKGKDKISIINGGKTIHGNWIQVRLLSKHEGVYLNGYVFDTFLSEHLSHIPPTSYYLYNSLVYSKKNKGKQYISFSNDFQDEVEAYGCKSTSLNDCAIRYEPNTTPFKAEGPSLINVSDPHGIPKKFFSIKKVDPTRLKKLVSDYTIDDSNPPKVETGEQWSHFSLKLNNDSLLKIEDRYGEVVYRYYYLGEIKKLNQYIIKGVYEDDDYYSIDKTTGEENRIDGYPHYSPNRKYDVYFTTIDFIMHPNFYTTNMIIKSNSPDSSKVSINLKSWNVQDGPNNLFWISENQFVVKASPVDNHINMWDNEKTTIHYDFLCITIKDWSKL